MGHYFVYIPYFTYPFDTNLTIELEVGGRMTSYTHTYIFYWLAAWQHFVYGYIVGTFGFIRTKREFLHLSPAISGIIPLLANVTYYRKYTSYKSIPLYHPIFPQVTMLFYAQWLFHGWSFFTIVYNKPFIGLVFFKVRVVLDSTALLLFMCSYSSRKPILHPNTFVALRYKPYT